MLYWYNLNNCQGKIYIPLASMFETVNDVEKIRIYCGLIIFSAGNLVLSASLFINY